MITSSARKPAVLTGERAEPAIKGRVALADGASILDAAAPADHGTDPPTDLAGTAGYRCHLARLLTRRALTAARV